MKPAKGLMKGDLQIFVVKVNPPDVRTYKQKLTMRLNDNNKYDQVRVMYQGLLYRVHTGLKST